MEKITVLFHIILKFINSHLLLVIIGWIVSLLLSMFIGYRKDRLLAGIILGLLAGPLGLLITLIMPYNGDITCPNCRKRTWWIPKQPGTGPPLTSEPHLRCFRCGKIIWNENEVRYGAFPTSRFGLFKKILNRFSRK